MITRRAKYALKALLYLARQPEGQAVLIRDLAKAERIPKKFLEQILLDLNRKGLLQSRKGKGGGYLLGKPPEKIMMGDVIRLTDGPLAPVPCVSKTAYHRCEECENERTCLIRRTMKEVREAIAGVMDRTSLADMLKKR
jgi:Rrf2 family protein